MKLNSLEKKWVFYDVGNSAFIMLATTIIPIVFKSLAKEKLDSSTYLAYWGYAVSAATLITALLGPVLGAIADRRKKRKFFFTLFMVLGVLGCMSLSLWSSWLVFLIFYILAKVGFNGSLIFYDSMLIDITTEDRMDNVSSHGYAWGYIGSCIPFVASIFLITGKDFIGLPLSTAITLMFLLNGLWWALWSYPLYRSYEQKYTNDIFYEGEDAFGRNKNLALSVFAHMVDTFREIKENRRIYLFLLSFLFYIDGVYTIINMATAYGSSLGLSDTGLILALLVTQLVAFPCALYFGRISQKFATEKLIQICIIAYGFIALYAVQLNQLYEFWILAIGVGMFQGAIQALSRSYFAKIIPGEKSGEYFGIYDIFGKGASLFGTLIVSFITHITGRQQLAIFSLVLMFVLGFYFFRRAESVED